MALTSSEFEKLARACLSETYGTPLTAGLVSGVPKRWDLTSPDGSIVGDAKYYTLVGGERLPPAKFSTIAEHVWLLEKVVAEHKFLVFGNDERVPRKWLGRHGHLVEGISFFFLAPDGTLTVLYGAEPPGAGS